MFPKDEDEEYSVSDHRYFEHADHGKREIREQKAHEKGELLKLQRQVLRGQVTDKKSVQQADEEDAAKLIEAAQAAHGDQKHQSFHTETLKEKEEKQKQYTSAQPDAAEVVERAQQEPEISDEEKTSEPG